MVFSLLKRMAVALGQGFVRLGRYWAAQFGIAGMPGWDPNTTHRTHEQEETEHWDWSIPYHWYETSR
ncbi:hypothetical protein [Microbispora sp. H11081]|uniref:hypothetical protein n=1 Tax=Microbispora sp. H11081 TaxID=2729107 RepID=UPI00147473EA|nr:hypothetical protein [Microbispora sp. H11081]